MCSPIDQAAIAIQSPVLKFRDGARYLGISQRLFWDLLAPRGPIETVKIGRRVVVLRASVDAFIETNTVRQSQVVDDIPSKDTTIEET